MASPSQAIVSNKYRGLFSSAQRLLADPNDSPDESLSLQDVMIPAASASRMGIPNPSAGGNLREALHPVFTGSHFDEAAREPRRGEFDFRHQWYRHLGGLGSLRTIEGRSFSPIATSTDDIGVYTEEMLLDLLAERGQTTVAGRIKEFFTLRSQEVDEPSVVMESLRSLVGFVIQTPNLAAPIIGSDPKGLMELEWHLHDNGNPDSFWGRGNGVVSMKFLKSGLIQYVALSGPYREGSERLEAQGVSTKAATMTSLGEFAVRIISPAREIDESIRSWIREYMLAYSDVFSHGFPSP